MLSACLIRSKCSTWGICLKSPVSPRTPEVGAVLLLEDRQVRERRGPALQRRDPRIASRTGGEAGRASVFQVPDRADQLPRPDAHRIVSLLEGRGAGTRPHHARAMRLAPHAPRLRDVLRAFVLRRRHPAPSPRCGSIGNELRAPRRLRAPRPTQAPSRRWPARPGGDSCRLLSTPVEYPSMREGRRLDAIRSLQAHRQTRPRHKSTTNPTIIHYPQERRPVNLL